MSRPSAEVIEQIELGTGQVWQILDADAYYVLTYKDRPFSLRTVTYTLNGPDFKYKKLTYTNLGNAAAQARLLNYRFKCDDFAVVEVDVAQAQ